MSLAAPQRAFDSRPCERLPNARMHVTFLMQDTGKLYGAEQATVDLVAGLAASGRIEVSATLVRETRLGKTDHCIERAFRDAGVPCHLLATRRPFSWSLVRDIRRHALARQIDCLHTIGYKMAVHACLAVRGGRLCPWISTVHGWLQRPNLKERLYEWLELQFLKRAQRVVVLSDHYRRLLLAKGLSPQRLAWIPSGLMLDSLHVDRANQPLDCGRRPPTIGMLGRLSWEKNHEMFLHVARRLLDRGAEARFLIAGDGPERLQIEGLIRGLRLETAVELAGLMPREQFFRRIDALAVCSRIENLPYAILEAMAWSRPVVATRVGGVPDLVEPDKTGLLVEPGDVEAMGRAIAGLLGDVPRARALGAAGRRRLEERFTLERSVEAHLEMYGQLANEA